MGRLEDLDRVLKHVWLEPKFKATMEWYDTHPDPVSQMFAQVGSRPASKDDEEVGAWLRNHADETVTVELHEPPDFDWWEPRHDQPWRRKQTRDREAGL